MNLCAAWSVLGLLLVPAAVTAQPSVGTAASAAAVTRASDTSDPESLGAAVFAALKARDFNAFNQLVAPIQLAARVPERRARFYIDPKVKVRQARWERLLHQIEEDHVDLGQANLVNVEPATDSGDGPDQGSVTIVFSQGGARYRVHAPEIVQTAAGWRLAGDLRWWEAVVDEAATGPPTSAPDNSTPEGLGRLVFDALQRRDYATFAAYCLTRDDVAADFDDNDFFLERDKWLSHYWRQLQTDAAKAGVDLAKATLVTVGGEAVEDPAQGEGHIHVFVTAGGKQYQIKLNGGRLTKRGWVHRAKMAWKGEYRGK